MVVSRGRVLNKHAEGGIPAGAKYIGRGSRHGNPFRIGPDGNREEVIEKHAAHIAQDTKYLRSLDELAGCDVVCFCAPRACHGDTLTMLATLTYEERLRWAQQLLKA